MHVPAVLVGINKARFMVDLSVRPSHLNTTEDYWMRQLLEQRYHTDRYLKRWWPTTGRNVDSLFDKYCSEKEALEAYRKAELASLNRFDELNAPRGSGQGQGQGQGSSAYGPSSNGTTAGSRGGAGGDGAGATGGGGSNSNGKRLQKARQIYHPLFANIDARGAEEKLKGRGAGEVIFRPSSKGPDALSITWAFQEEWVKHIDIEERGKTPGQLTLGKQLFIKEPDMQEAFSDLDEIHARYIEPMNDYVNAMTSHSHFRQGSKEEVEVRRKSSPKLLHIFPHHRYLTLPYLSSHMAWVCYSHSNCSFSHCLFLSFQKFNS
jgi:hypothetical protein